MYNVVHRNSIESAAQNISSLSRKSLTQSAIKVVLNLHNTVFYAQIKVPKFTEKTRRDTIISLLNGKTSIKVLYFGVGGGSDVVLGLANKQYLSSILPENTEVEVYLANAKNGRPKESPTDKFKDWKDGMYLVESDKSIDLIDKSDRSKKVETNRTLLLESYLSYQFDINVYVADVDDKRLVDTLNSLNLDLIVAVDTGGDSLIKESIDPEHRDQTSILLLDIVKNTQGNKVPLIHTVIAPGIDGETSIEEMNKALQKIEKKKEHTIEPVDTLLPYLEYWKDYMKPTKTLCLIMDANSKLKSGLYKESDLYQPKRFFEGANSTPYLRTAQIYSIYHGFPHF